MVEVFSFQVFKDTAAALGRPWNGAEHRFGSTTSMAASGGDECANRKPKLSALLL